MKKNLPKSNQSQPHLDSIDGLSLNLAWLFSHTPTRYGGFGKAETAQTRRLHIWVALVFFFLGLGWVELAVEATEGSTDGDSSFFLLPWVYLIMGSGKRCLGFPLVSVCVRGRRFYTGVCFGHFLVHYLR